MKKPQIRAMWARKAARGDRGLQMPSPRTAPLGVILVAGLPTDKALEVVRDLETPAVIEQALRAERRCQARSAVIEALEWRLTAMQGVARERAAKAGRKRGRVS